MKPELDNLLLTAALAPPLKAKSAWEAWSNEVKPQDAPHVLSWAGGYIYLNLKNLGEENHYLRGIFRHNFLANNFRMSQVKATVDVLAKNWEISPIKSFGMSIGDNSLGLRPIADFDFYVKGSQASEVFKFLEAHGYKANLEMKLTEFESRLFKRRGSWNFVNSEGFDLDLHWRLFDHLSIDENEELLLNNSKTLETKHGKFRMLTPELMCVLLINHHLLNTSTHYSGLFDISRVIGQSNLDTLADLASRAGIFHESLAILQEIDEYAETTNASALVTCPDEPRPSAKNFLLDKSIDYELIRMRALYRYWNKKQRPSWMEKFVTKYLGGFVNSNHSKFDTFQGMGLGSGWHYQYPGDKHRWLNIGDSRFTFLHLNKGKYQLSLSYDVNSFNLIAHVNTMSVYANGELIGIIDKSNLATRFEYTVHRKSKIEFSIRSEGEPYDEVTGFDFNWRLLSLPVLAIQINELPA